MKINPECLQELRKRKLLTRQRLSDLAGIHARTIQRLENDPDRCQKTREDTLNCLAKALDVEPGVLTGELTLPEFDKAPTDNSKRVQIGAQIAPKARLAYDLIKRRYGVSVTDIINMAPLFFTLLAEGSLAWRREKLREAYEAFKRLEEVGGFWRGGLSGGETYIYEGTAAEEDSVGKADLFGEHLFSEPDTLVYKFFDPSDNPFASYLHKLANELAIPDIVDVDDSDLWFGLLMKFPDYDICSEELDRIANRSLNARRALETGHARISDIPEELMAEDAGEERAKWLEERLPDILKDILKQGKGNIVVDLVATSPETKKVMKLLGEIQKTNSETEKGGGDQ